jgi:S-adenosylmethionine:diacylglycerol 3-amino-3-carboxypropyl transferase
MEALAVAFRMRVCDFPLRDNYFAWQVVARHTGAKPSRLRRDAGEVIRTRTN